MWGHMVIVEGVIEFPMIDKNGDAIECINIPAPSNQNNSLGTSTPKLSSQHEGTKSTNNADLPIVGYKERARTPIQESQSLKRKHEESEEVELSPQANKDAPDTESAIVIQNTAAPKQNIPEANGSTTEPEKVSSLLSNDDVPSSLLSESVIADMEMSTVFAEIESMAKTTKENKESLIDQNGNTFNSSEKESAEKGDTKAGPTAYAKKTESERSEMLLRWLHLPEEVLQNTLEHKYRIMKHDIDIDPHVLKDSFIDDEVKISSMKNFFDKKVFVEFQAVLKKKKEGRIRNCGTCSKKIMRSGVKCDSCLIWYHLKCASLKRAPNKVEWFCPNCL